MNDFERQEMKDRIFKTLWNGRGTTAELKARCGSDEEKQIVDEVAEQVEKMDHDFRAGFKAGMTF